MAGPQSSNPIINAIASAIASAEGYGVSGAKPTVTNNPGDIGNYPGHTTIFEDAQAGWDALTNQIELIFSGSSAHYSPDMTIAQVGQIYSGGDPNWAINVASRLGVSPNTPLNQIPGGAAALESAAAASSGTPDGTSLLTPAGPDLTMPVLESGLFTGSDGGGVSVGLLVGAGVLLAALAWLILD